jgi:hypothetical protein
MRSKFRMKFYTSGEVLQVVLKCSRIGKSFSNCMEPGIHMVQLMGNPAVPSENFWGGLLYVTVGPLGHTPFRKLIGMGFFRCQVLLKSSEIP